MSTMEIFKSIVFQAGEERLPVTQVTEDIIATYDLKPQQQSYLRYLADHTEIEYFDDEDDYND
jgi:hypothetical protein